MVSWPVLSLCQFRAACKAAKIGQDWTPRELRHSFVSLMSSSGVPVEEIARLAGHSNMTASSLLATAQVSHSIEYSSGTGSGPAARR